MVWYCLYRAAVGAVILVLMILIAQLKGAAKRNRKAVLAWATAAGVVVLGAFYRHDYWVQFAVTVALLAGTVYNYRQFRWGLTYYLTEHLNQAFLLLAFLLMVWGWSFAWLGVPDLIWHEDLWLRFLSAVSATFLLALLGTIAFNLISVGGGARSNVRGFYKVGTVHYRFANWLIPWLRGATGRRAGVNPLHFFLWVAQFPFLLLLVLPALCPSFFPYVPRLTSIRPNLYAYLVGLVVWVAGLVMGVVLVKVGMKIGEHLSVYSDKFAEAVGVAAREAFGALSGLLDWLGGWGARGLSLVTSVWQWIAGPGGPVVWKLPKAPGVGNVGVLVKGREEQTKTLFAFVVGVTLFYLALNLADAFGPAWMKVPPGPALFSLLALVAILAGLVRLLLDDAHWYWRFPLFVGLVAWVAWANRSIDKLRYENMPYEDYAKVHLREKVKATYFPSPSAVAGPGAGAVPDDLGLVDDSCAREAWRARMMAKLPASRKPKLVVICCSGGGARSLVWTSLVLDRLGGALTSEKLDGAIQDFDESVRMVAAGSAGAVGAGYYVKALYDNWSRTRTPAEVRLPPRGWSGPKYIPRDSESTVVRSIALGEIWRMFNAYPVGGAPPEDRGRILEANWTHLRQVPLEELRPAEQAGEIPSLIAEPVTLEDGRRLFISNLDLGRNFNAGAKGRGRGLVLCGGFELLFGREARDQSRGDPALLGQIADLESGRDFYADATSQAPALKAPDSDVAPTNFSLTGIEFSKTFDRSNGFRLATAARMSGALPMFTPAVYLPSEPALRVIDSGFFDNYGIDVASAWLFANYDWLREHTSGVLLVQIRTIGRREDRTGVPPQPSGPTPVLLRGYQVVGSVVEGALKAFSTGAIFRNDRDVAWLSELFNARKGGGHPSDFFTTVIFENTAIARSHPDGPPSPDRDADRPNWDASFGAMTWVLTEADDRSMQESLPGSRPSGIEVEGTGLVLIKNLHQKLKEIDPGDEDRRAALTWELERAENYERLEALKTWWVLDHEPGTPMASTPSPGAKKAGNRGPP
jgi:hypothetical protein